MPLNDGNRDGNPGRTETTIDTTPTRIVTIDQSA